MRYLYILLAYLSLPFLFIRLWYKGKKIPEYRQRWAERLGFIPPVSSTKTCFWVHAVSLGETIAAKPLIQAIQAAYPDIILVVTTTTVSGSKIARQWVNQHLYHYYLPYDTPDAIQRFLRRIHPRQIIIIETELWPNLLYYAAQAKIPVLLANARLSERSLQGYLRIATLTHQMLSYIHCIAAQTKTDADRFVKAGATVTQLQILGNIKFDLSVPIDLVEKGHTRRQNWGENRPTIIAASTHENEEVQVLEAFKLLQKQIPNVLLILVPRHAERFEKVWKLCQAYGFCTLRDSQEQMCTPDTAILLGDSVGRLFLYYSLADIAFVGGSLVTIGGHNPLEPAALDLPILSGPHVFNFTDIYTLLTEANAVKLINDVNTLFEACLLLLTNTPIRQEMGKQAKQVVLNNRGAVQRHLAVLTTAYMPFLTPSSKDDS